MHTRHSGNGGIGADRRARARAGRSFRPSTLSSPSEQLDYIAAMVQELKIMSAQADYRTLAGLLELAYHEAVRRRRAGE